MFASGVVNIVTREPRQFTINADARYNPAGRKHFGPEVYSSDNWWDIGRLKAMPPPQTAMAIASPILRVGRRVRGPRRRRGKLDGGHF